MVERWINTGRLRWPAWRRSIGRALGTLPAGAWVMALALLLAGIGPLRAHINRRADLDAIANEAGSISYTFYRNGNAFGIRDAFGTHADSPLVDHGGNRVLYCQTLDNGGGAYVANLASGEGRLVFEEMATNFFNGPSTALSVHAWSPDDAKFIYSRSGCTLIICDAATGKPLAETNIPSLKALVWMTPHSFACVDDKAKLHLVEEQKDGSWQRTGKPVGAGYASLARLSDDTVAWSETNRLVALDLPSRATNVLLELHGKALKEFDYSQATGRFLLVCAATNHDSLWRLEPGAATNQGPSLIVSAPSIRNARWINSGKGYACLQTNRLVIRADAASQEVRLFDEGKVDAFTVSADGQHLVMAAVASNEPALGIWEYDVGAGKARCVVPAAERGLAHIQPAVPQFRIIPGPTNRNLWLVIYKPVPFDRHKAYPLVIANTPYGAAEPYMKQYALAVANAGAYFVVLDRPGWFGKDGFGDAWSENEPYVINLFAGEPTVDPKRVFLVSNCVESQFLKEYAAKHPGACSGAIMLIAGELPNPEDLASGRYPARAFISTCDVWEGKGDRLRKYQATASQSGVEVAYTIHRNTKHDFVSKESQRDRIRGMLHLIFDE